MHNLDFDCKDTQDSHLQFYLLNKTVDRTKLINVHCINLFNVTQEKSYYIYKCVT